MAREQEVAPTLGPTPCPLPHPEEGAGVILIRSRGTESPEGQAPRLTLSQATVGTSGAEARSLSGCGWNSGPPELLPT